MSLTETIRLDRDRQSLPPHRDPFPDTDFVEDVTYARGATSTELRYVASCVIYEQSIDWANKIALARIGVYKHPLQSPSERFTAKLWNQVTWDSGLDSIVNKQAPKRTDLAIALAPFVDADDEWAMQLVDTFLDLSQLDYNWNGIGGEPFRNEEAVRGMMLLSALRQETPAKPFVYPAPEGGVVVEFFSPSGKVTVVVEGNLGIVAKEGEMPITTDLSRSNAWEGFVNQIRETFRQ